MIAAFSPGSDFKRYYRGRMPRLALVVIVLMPLMYGALYLWAFWDPFGKVDKVPVAIVNLDEGATSQGEHIDAGTDVVTGLIASKQLDLHEVSNDEAVDGLAHGTYYFTITLPKDFSESVVSAAGTNPRSAELLFTYNDTNNYLSTVIGQDAAEEVINQVSAQVGEQVFESAITGVKGVIPKIKTAAGQVEELNTGMEEADTGAQELADNLVTAKNGAESLSDALDELDTVVDNTVGKADTLVNASGLTSSEIQKAAARVTSNTNTVDEDLSAIVSTQDAVNSELQGVIDDLNASGDPAQEALAQRLVTTQQNVLDSQVGQGITDTFANIKTDVSAISGELDNPSSRINKILRSVENGGVQKGLDDVKTAADELRTGADTLSSGLVELSEGASTLASGTSTLASGTDQMNTAVQLGLKLIPTWNNDQQESFIKTIAQPVQLKEQINNEAKTFGYGFAPFFCGLALFVGCVIAWMLFTPLQSRPLAQGLGSFRVVLASYAPTYAIGALQATILFLVLRFAIGLEPKYQLGTYLFLLLMVAMFLAMIQMFNAVFGPAVGRVITLAFLMVMLTSAGGIYPVPTTAVPFQYLHWGDPMTFTVTGLRQLILGGVDYRLTISIVVIVALTAAFIGISTWAARRNRQYNMDRLYPPLEV